MSTPTCLIKKEISQIKFGYDGFCLYEKSDYIIQRGKQTFAVFSHGTAYDITPRRWGVVFLPAIVKGRAIGQFPDEGRSGILHIWKLVNPDETHMNVPKRIIGRWFCGFIPCGWLHEKELQHSNEEITDNIISEIEAGHNVLTSPPPGWA